MLNYIILWRVSRRISFADSVGEPVGFSTLQPSVAEETDEIIMVWSEGRRPSTTKFEGSFATGELWLIVNSSQFGYDFRKIFVSCFWCATKHLFVNNIRWIIL